METSFHEYTFTRKSEALRVIRRLWDYGLLSRRIESARGRYVVRAEIPARYSYNIDRLVEGFRRCA